MDFDFNRSITMKKFIFPLLLSSLLLFGFSYTSREYKIFIHLDDTVIEFIKRISGFHESTPTELHIYPKEIYTTQIGDKKLYVIKADPKRSDTRGLFFALQHNYNFKGLDYIYWPFEDWVTEIILFDLDKDSIDEVITLWQGEEAFNIRVFKFDLNLERREIFYSSSLFNPLFTGYKRKMLIHKDTLFIIYSIQPHGRSVNKKAMLAINPDDPTRELFLMPLGIVKKEEWLSLQKEK